jgi:hypothetical protein
MAIITAATPGAGTIITIATAATGTDRQHNIHERTGRHCPVLFAFGLRRGKIPSTAASLAALDAANSIN